jgi:hypothetical protein
MSDDSLSQSEIILSQVKDELTRASMCKNALQDRPGCRRAMMREIEHDITPKDSHA